MPKKLDAEQAIADPKLGYEQAVAELEGLIGKMESGKLSLEDTLESYKRGAQLLKHCQGILDQVEQQVKIFQEKD